MQITITRSGGFVWWPQKLGPVDTEALPQETANKVGELIAKINFFNLPPDIAGPAGPSVFDYSTTVTDGARRHTVHFNDNSPEDYLSQMNELIQLLVSSGAEFGPPEPPKA